MAVSTNAAIAMFVFIFFFSIKKTIAMPLKRKVHFSLLKWIGPFFTTGFKEKSDVLIPNSG